MEMAYELSHNMFKDDYIFSLIYVGWGDVFSPGSPFKEMDTWKGKVEAIDLQ